jgi:hypothetical protein
LNSNTHSKDEEKSEQILLKAEMIARSPMPHYKNSVEINVILVTFYTISGIIITVPSFGPGTATQLSKRPLDLFGNL